MENQKFKTKLELIQELGISRATFYRLLEKKNRVAKPISGEALSKGEYLRLLDVSSFTPGLYQYRLSVGKTVTVGKFAKN